MVTLSSTKLYGENELKFIRVNVSNKPYWEFVTRTNASEGVTIVAITKKREIVLVRQLRIPLGVKIIELPGGLVGDNYPGETAKDAVQKELLEETGYGVDKADIKLLAKGPVLAGLTNEINSLWLASNAIPLESGGGVNSEGEDIEILILPLETVKDRLIEFEKEGYLIDLKIFSGLHFLKDAQRS